MRHVQLINEENPSLHAFIDFRYIIVVIILSISMMEFFYSCFALSKILFFKIFNKRTCIYQKVKKESSI